MADKADAGTALATREAAQLEQIRGAILDGDPLPFVSDPEVMSRAIAERILGSETFEEAFTAQSLPAWRELEGVPVIVRDVRFNRSGFEGQSLYAVVDIAPVDQTLPPTTVSCGGKNVMAQLYVMVKNGWQDRPVQLISKRTTEGYDALWLEDSSNPLDG